MDGSAEPANGEEFLGARLAARLRELRQSARLTQEGLARRAGYGRTYVTLLESGRIVPGREVVGRLGEVLGAQEELLRLRAETAQKARRDEPIGRNEADQEARLHDHRAYIPLVGDDEVAAAITEARELGLVRGHSAVHGDHLEELDRDVDELDVAWHHVPLPEIFRRARALRNKVTAYLNNDPTEEQRLRLIVLGGTLHAHLAEALLDLGYFTAAWSQTSTGLVLARDANLSELRVVLYSQRSRIRYWQGFYDVAVVEAESGAASVRPGSSAAVKLFDKLALAASRMGDTKQARRALRACEDARDAATGTSYLTPIGEEFCSMGAAYSLVELGDLTAAQRHAQYAVSRYEARGPLSVNLTFARLGLAKAQPDPTAAAEVGTSAIETYLAQHRRSQMIVVAARQLDAGLPDGVPEVEDFRERLHALEVSTRQVIPGV